MAKQEPSEYFIDESGNTGDLSTIKIGSYFSDQRMFALAAFGCMLDNEFTDKFRSLKAAHRMLGDEVKSKQTYEKPRFILDLLDLLETYDCPIFIELVDKHYFIVMNIIERMVAVLCINRHHWSV
jgi:hypothetical protein